MRFNKSIFNISAWITLLITYILPAQSIDEFSSTFGYPFGYLTIYNKPVDTTLISSFNLNIVGVVINILIIYCVIYWGKAILDKRKK